MIYLIARYWPHILMVTLALSIAGVVGHAVWTWGRDTETARTVAAEARAEAAEAELTGWRSAAVRDALSDTATNAARSATDAQLTDHQTRAERVEDIAHAPRPPVPAVCPDPDPRLVRELAEGRSRVRAAEDRLRGLRPATSGGAE